jgi:hypothetical protein
MCHLVGEEYNTRWTPIGMICANERIVLRSVRKGDF